MEPDWKYKKELEIRNIRSIRKALKVFQEIEEENNTKSMGKKSAVSLKQNQMIIKTTIKKKIK